MKIVIIDGQGGRVGRQLIEGIRQGCSDADITAVGTNAMATACMMKASPTRSATGENAVLVACRRADLIAGPLGIALADALGGEVTPAMSIAVAQSPARRVLIPFNQCETWVAGAKDTPMSALLADALEKITAILSE